VRNPHFRLSSLARRSQARWPALGLLIRPFKFGLIGLSGVLINTAVLWVLVHQAHVALLPASALATETAILSNFLLNDCWTFAANSRHEPRWQRLLRFNGVALGGMVITMAVLSALVSLLPVGIVLANLAAVGCATVWNYTINSRWTWAARSSRS
jgi:dolichol-phosphate mannosyltransferase